MLGLSLSVQAQTYENQFSRPLGDVLNDIQSRFQVRLKYDIDTVGKVLSYADFRIRPYSVEESLTNVLAPFDFKFVAQGGNLYKLKKYEYPRRTEADGKKLLGYLDTLYTDRTAWEQRKACLRKEIREKMGIDSILNKRVRDPKTIFSKIRKFEGYTVQNFALETLPGLYVCGSVYAPRTKGKHALIICPNGHFGGGRYREDQQQRMGTLARMGAICVDYDLFGWGESYFAGRGSRPLVQCRSCHSGHERVVNFRLSAFCPQGYRYIPYRSERRFGWRNSDCSSHRPR